jgi:hypothetical protein
MACVKTVEKTNTVIAMHICIKLKHHHQYQTQGTNSHQQKKNHHPLIFTAPKANSMVISLQFFDRPTDLINELSNQQNCHKKKTTKTTITKQS